jgi:hypothetical protein
MQPFFQQLSFSLLQLLGTYKIPTWSLIQCMQDKWETLALGTPSSKVFAGSLRRVK